MKLCSFMKLQTKMRVLPCVFLFVLSEARDTQSNNYDDESPSMIQGKVDILPASFPEPVPFGHITIDGVGDPFSVAKPPVDLLELDMIEPRNPEEAKQMLKKGRKHIMFAKNKIPKGFANPRDMYLRDIVQPPQESNTTQLKWYSLADLQLRNAMMPSYARNTPRKKEPAPRHRPPPESGPKQPHFAKHNFELKQDQEVMKVNWTTCDQFAVGAVFDPKDIVDISWTPFYIWSIVGYAYAIVHKFTYPSKKVVYEYRSKYNKFLNKTVDWSKPKLLLNGMNEMLLIAIDKKGLFDAIAKHEIPESAKRTPVTLPSLTIRLKIEDPYLVMMFCEDYFATVMAVSGNEPKTYRVMKEEAATIKFVGTGQPVWRDYEGEQEKQRLINEAKIAEENDKFIKIDGPYPPISQYD